jgi:hypothetical protein
MATYDFSASALIPAPAQKVYNLIADYRNGHPRILPKPHFVSLNVEQGGYGAGTVINFQMRVLGRTQSFHSRIKEPKPGRVLVEIDMNTGATTTFTVEPRKGGQEAFVTIATTVNVANGVFGRLQGWLTSLLLRPIYVKELDQLAAVATENK